MSIPKLKSFNGGLYILTAIALPLTALMFAGWVAALLLTLVMHLLWGAFELPARKVDEKMAVGSPKRYVSVDIDGRVRYGISDRPGILYVIDRYRWEYCDLRKNREFVPLRKKRMVLGDWVMDSEGELWVHLEPFSIADRYVPQVSLLKAGRATVLINFKTLVFYDRTIKKYREFMPTETTGQNKRP